MLVLAALAEEIETAIPDAALILSGFVLAHSAWNVSDLPKGGAALSVERPIMLTHGHLLARA
jgi:hypothetical protein